jgi:putative transposase
MDAAEKLAPNVGTASACRAMGVSRATLYRRRHPQAAPDEGPRRQPRALDAAQRQEVLELLHSDRFTDKAPAAVYAALLDQGTYHCSIRTMYRILHENEEVRERRNQLRHPSYQKPQLLATAPGQVWTWDITKLLTTQKWTYYYLYVILDLFSRYVVGWMLAHRESTDLASRLIRETVDKQGVDRNQLTIHSDRGPSMSSQGVAQLLATLGVTKSHSRPHVSNDNPFSESQFKTMKYCPEFPDRFTGYDHALGFCRRFFPWYNDEHYHSGIGLLTPAMLHYGRAADAVDARRRVLQEAYAAHPERFVRGVAEPPPLPTAVWINPPQPAANSDDATQQKRPPEIHVPRKPHAPLTHPRPGYPSPGCVPAEPDSVSPGESDGNRFRTQPQLPLNTRAMPQKIPGVWEQCPQETVTVIAKPTELIRH